MGRLLIIVALLAMTFGFDIAYEAWVPGYDGSDAASAVGAVNQIAFIALIIELVVSWILAFSRSDR